MWGTKPIFHLAAHKKNKLRQKPPKHIEYISPFLSAFPNPEFIDTDSCLHFNLHLITIKKGKLKQNAFPASVYLS